jgi:predicted DNA-binding transcriptional regulator AlpA
MLWTIKDLVRELCMSRAAIYTAIGRGELPRAFHLGRSARWYADEIRAAIAKLAAAERGVGGEVLK